MYTYRIGLIEWMENTCTLKDFLFNTRTEEEQKATMRYINITVRLFTNNITFDIFCGNLQLRRQHFGCLHFVCAYSEYDFILDPMRNTINGSAKFHHQVCRAFGDMQRFTSKYICDGKNTIL